MYIFLGQPCNSENDEEKVEQFSAPAEVSAEKTHRVTRWTGEWGASLSEEEPVEDSGQDEAQHGAAARAHQSHESGEVGDSQYYQT